MRTLAYKLLSLLVMLVGMFLLAGLVDRTVTATILMDKMPNLTGPFFTEGGALDWQRVGFIASAIFILVGVNGLFFRKYSGAGKISFHTDHGEMVIELATIQKTLERVITALPEVRRARVRVTPEKDGRRVHVQAQVTLQNCAEQGLRKTVHLVSDCISEAVRSAMGLEDLATVQLVVKGVHVDARATARRLHDEAETRTERQGTDMAAALARPPISSVTMEELAPAAPESAEETLPPLAPVGAEEAVVAAAEPAEEVLPPLEPVAAEEAVVAAPETVEDTLPPLEPAAAEEAKLPEPEPGGTALPPLSSLALEDFETDAPKPAAVPELVIEDLPLAVSEASGDAGEDDLPPLDQSDFSTSSLHKPLSDEAVS